MTKTPPKWTPYQGAISRPIRPLTKRHRREYPERDLVHLPLMKMVRKHPILGSQSKLFFHVENERKTQTYAQGAMRKAMGVKTGVSDFILLVAKRGFNGLVLELKAPGKHLTEPQSDFFTQASRQNYCIKMACCPIDAYDFLMWYLGEGGVE